ncbi:MAG TPA: hypothetical protein VF576_01225, partial [Rubricoccaceae bacterium]
LAVLRAMSRDDKNYTRRGEVALAQARVLAASGDADGARARFFDVLYNPDLAGQSVRGEAHYRLAEFYRDALGDYVTAAAHFDTAATAIATAPTAAERPSRAAIVGAAAVATTYETVSRTSRRIAAIDSLLALGTLDEEAFQARIAEIESVRRAEWVQQRREADALRTAQDFGGQGLTTSPFGSDPGSEQTTGRGVTTPGTEGLGGMNPGSDPNAGFLGHRDPRSVQAGQLAFQRIYGDRPLVPNWRRRSAVQGGAIASGVGLGQTPDQFVTGLNGLAGPPPLDLSGVPRTPEAQADLITERASLRYELANTFFLSLDRADRAGVLYRQILDETPDAPVAARTRYALAELESSEGRLDEAAPLYRDVALTDSLGPLGRAALARLEGREPVAATPVLSDEAETIYSDARSLWDVGDPLGAAAALVALGSADPDGEGAPRAFFAAALAYADWARTDTLGLTAPLPPALIPAALVEVAPASTPAPVEPSVPPSDLPADAPTLDDLPVQTRGSRRDRRAPRPALPRPEPVGAPAPVGADSLDAGELLSAPAVDTPPSIDPDSVLSEPVQPDLPVDSSAVFTGTDVVPPDTLSPPPFTLREYLQALAARYPETVYARRAQEMVVALATPDGTGAPSRGSLEAVTFDGFFGRAKINTELGGFVWRIGPLGSLAEALGPLDAAQRAGVRAFAATDGTAFFVLLGQFEDPTAATLAAERVDRTALAGATVVPLGDVLTILSPEEVTASQGVTEEPAPLPADVPDPGGEAVPPRE